MASKGEAKYCGIGVLFVNHFKENPGRNRKVAEEEKNNYVKLFEALGLEMILKEERTLKEMEGDLEAVTKDSRLQDCGILVIALSSHGGESGIFGVNIDSEEGKGISDDFIKRKFNASKCPNIQHKPKLILRNGFRGNTVKLEAKVSIDPLPSGSTVEEKRGTDFLTICSTVDEFPAFKQMDTASGFIPLLKDAIEKNPNKSLYSLLKDVNLQLVENTGDLVEIGDDTVEVHECLSTYNELKKEIIFNAQEKTVSYV